MAFEHEDNSQFRQGSPSTRLVQSQGLQYYGAIEGGFGSTTFEPDGDFDDDYEYEFLVDEQLARDGLYRGNYRNQVLLYTVVPLTTLLSFSCLALVPTVLVFATEPPSLFPYPPYLPFPIPEVLTATALWSLSYLLRDVLDATALFIASPLTIITITLSATLQTIFNLLLRQIAIPILLIPYYSSKHLAHPTWQDDAFRRVWWVALGWAAVEAVVGVKQGYESIALYKDVLVSVNTSAPGQGGSRNTYAMEANKTQRASQNQYRDEREDVDAAVPKQTNGENQREWLNGDLTSSPTQRTRYSRSLSVDSNHRPMEEHPPPISNERQPLLRISTQRPNDGFKRLQAENEVERDLDQLIALKNREELEEVYGMPVIQIPVFISCLHRINSILSSLGICLLLSAAYMQSTFAIPTPPTPLPLPSVPSFSSIGNPNPSPIASNRFLVLTTLPILFIYIFLAMMHTPLVLPRIGIHTFVYLELLVSLGVFFGGLAVWDVLS